MAKKDRERRKITYGSAKTRAENHDVGFTSKAVDRPEGVSFFRLKKEGTYRVIIAPFIAGKGNPCADEGQAYFERTFYVHRMVGPNSDTYCCPAKCFDKPCVICEQQAKLRRKGKSWKDPAVKSLNPSERQLFWIKDVTTEKEADKGWQIWDMSFHLFGKLLDSRVKSSDEDDNYENFWHLKKGMVLKLTVEEDSMGESSTFYRVTAIDFKTRKEDLPEDLLDELTPLDDLIKEVSYKELKKAFYATAKSDDDDEDNDDDEDSDEDDDEDEKPAKKKGKGKKVKDEDDNEDDEDMEEEDDEDDEDSEDDDEDDGDEEEESDIEPGDTVKWKYKKKPMTGTVTKINKKTKLCTVEVDDQEKPSFVDLKDLTKVADDEDDEPKKKKKKGKKVKEEDDEDDDIPFDEDDDDTDEDEDEDSDDDEDEDEEDEAPRKKVAKRGKKVKGSRDDDDD